MAGKSDDERLLILVEARITDLEKNMRKASATTGREYGKMRRDSKSAMTAMEQDAIRSTTRINAALAATSTKIGAVGKAAMLGAATGLGAGLIAALAPIALFSKALEVVNDASHLVDTAAKIGITTDALQALSFGFSQAGVDASTFETGMTQFSKRIGEAAIHGGRLADILKANGVAMRDANGQIRKSEDLLPEYADLIKNARTEQEKMLLVTEAFGRGGGDMLNGLNQGAQGIANMGKEARESGLIIDKDLLERAEAMGDRWEKAWSRFKTASNNAILTAMANMDQLNQMLITHEKLKNAASAGDLAGSLVGKPGDVLTPGTRDRPTGADAALADRIGGALSTSLDAADQKLIEELQKRYDAVTKKPKVDPTIVPGDGDDKGGGRAKTVKAAVAELDAVTKLIDQLRIERAEIGMTDVERAKSQALRQAGADATKGERDEIEFLIDAIYRENDALEQLKERQEAFAQAGEYAFGMVGDAITGIIDKSVSAEDALKKLVVQLALAAIQGALLGSGPFGGLFKSSGGGGDPWAGMRRSSALAPSALPALPLAAANRSSPAANGNAPTIIIHHSPSYQADNASAEAVAKLADMRNRDQAELPANVLKIIQKLRAGRMI